MWWRTHAFLFKMCWTFKTSHAIFASSYKSLGITMLLDADGPLGVKIEPTIGLESWTKFFNSKWIHHNQNPHPCAHSIQFDLPFGFWFRMEKTKKLQNLVYKLTMMTYNFFPLMNFKIHNSKLEPWNNSCESIFAA